MLGTLPVAVVGWTVLAAVTVLVCAGLFVFAFVSPVRSYKPQRDVDAALDKGEEAGGSAPGGLGAWLRKPFGTSRKATDKSTDAGRKSRAKAPF